MNYLIEQVANKVHTYGIHYVGFIQECIKR